MLKGRDRALGSAVCVLAFGLVDLGLATGDARLLASDLQRDVSRSVRVSE